MHEWGLVVSLTSTNTAGFLRTNFLILYVDERRVLCECSRKSFAHDVPRKLLSSETRKCQERIKLESARPEGVSY